MSLSLFLVGKDSEFYDFLKDALEEALRKAELQSHEAGRFQLSTNERRDLIGEVGAYENLHALRGYAACLEFDGVAPRDSLESIEYYKKLKPVYEGLSATQRFPHLINHSDCGGYYLPVDFPTPVSLDNRSFALGTDGPFGSSQRLVAELEDINQSLGVREDDLKLEDEAFWDSLLEAPFRAEKWTWSVLYRLAQESISQKLILTFG